MNKDEDTKTRPPLPIEQRTYYILSAVNTFLLLSTFTQGVDITNPLLFGMISVSVVLLILLIATGHKMKEKNPWLYYSQFLRNKEANLANSLVKAEGSYGIEYTKLNMRIYRRNLRIFLADLKQFRNIALSENRTDLANNLLTQIHQWQEVLSKNDKT